MYGVAGERRLTEFELPWLAGLRRLGAGADRQRRERAAPGRRLRRGDGRALPGTRARAREGAARMGSSSSALLDHLERDLGASRTKGSGRSAASRRHFVHSKVMAWVAFDRAVRTVEEQGLDGPVDRWRELRERDPRGGVRPRLRRVARLVRPVVRLEGARREPPAHPARRLPAGRRPARARHGRGGRARAPARRARAALPHARRGRRRPAGRARASFCRARSGSSTATSCSAGTTRRTRSSTGSSASRTTSACSPRSTTREAKRLLGNFPQAFTHLALVNSAFNVLPHLPSPMHRRHAQPQRSAVTEVVRGRAASRARRRPR